jgi:NAD(P)-dependent dehydrogenase (short-subunit alcohol dehydrogenase family)
MAKIFITGSADGLGQMAAKLLISLHHEVVLHARNAARGIDALKNVPGAEKVVTGDLSSIAETKNLARQVNALGRFDAIIHNAGVYQVSKKLTFAVNSIAPYILTCLIQKPERLVYLSSGMHRQGSPQLQHLNLETGASYADSKLHVLILSKIIANKWSGVYANTVDPGWVPTKMGGPNAPDNLQKGVETQVWLAVSNDEKTKVSGAYFHHKKADHYSKAADDLSVQQEFLAVFERITGVRFPNGHDV